MALKVKGGYNCGYCKKFYTDPVNAENCKESHKLIYVGITKEDLNRLLLFIYTKEDNVLGEHLVQLLQNYLKANFITDETSMEKDG